MTHSRKFVAMLACCVAASAVLVGNASAGQISRSASTTRELSYIENYCGVAGLTVSDEFVVDGKVGAVPHGPDGFAYFLENFKETEVLTNVANGKTVTLVNDAHREGPEGDRQRRRDADDPSGSGRATPCSTEQTARRLRGTPVRADSRLLVDHGGTPTDPDDDELIDLEVVKGSTGRSDDVCAAAVEALT